MRLQPNIDFRCQPASGGEARSAKDESVGGCGFSSGGDPPPRAAFIPVLRQLGFSGSDEQVLEKVARQAPHWLSSASSASPMWVANAATFALQQIRWTESASDGGESE
ncbi:N-succinylarginine dihydrolase [Shigella flexneri]